MSNSHFNPKLKDYPVDTPLQINKKNELLERAKAVGLNENSTEVEIVAKEKALADQSNA